MQLPESPLSPGFAAHGPYAPSPPLGAGDDVAVVIGGTMQP
jgi:hypothetical protein